MKLAEHVFQFILVLGFVTYGKCKSHLTCFEGTSKTAGYVLDYTVKMRHLSHYDCLRESDLDNEIETPPGRPRILNITVRGHNLTVLWQPPDDGSFIFLMGFLVEVFVDTHVESTGPDACYEVQLEKPISNESHRRPNPLVKTLLKDAVFNLQCIIDIQTPTDLDIYITSFPLPSWSSNKHSNIAVHFTGNESWTNQKPEYTRNVTSVIKTSEPSWSVTHSIVLVGAVAVITCIVTVTAWAFNIIRKRKIKKSTETIKKDQFTQSISEENSSVNHELISNNAEHCRIDVAPMSTDLDQTPCKHYLISGPKLNVRSLENMGEAETAGSVVFLPPSDLSSGFYSYSDENVSFEMPNNSNNIPYDSRKSTFPEFYTKFAIEINRE